MADNNSIKIAVVGVGNLTSAMVQAIEYYKHNSTDDLMHPLLGGFTISDIDVVAAYDIDKRKIGKDLAEAIFSPPNNESKAIDIPATGVKVEKISTLDGVSQYATSAIEISNEADVNIVESIVKSGAELLVLNTPSGANDLAAYCAQAALDANVGFINSTPSKIIQDNAWVRKFKDKRLPMIGDDLQSQAGGTVFHKGLLEVLNEHGVKVKDTYQLDVSGGLEGLTTLEFERRNLKRRVKEESIKRSLPYDINVAAGTTDYLDFLGSRRLGHYWVFGEGFLGNKIEIDIRMKSDDGANGAASLVDAVRAGKIALGRGVSGPVKSVCAHYFKAPPDFCSRTEAIEGFNAFISGERES